MKKLQSKISNLEKQYKTEAEKLIQLLLAFFVSYSNKDVCSSVFEDQLIFMPSM